MKENFMYKDDMKFSDLPGPHSIDDSWEINIQKIPGIDGIDGIDGIIKLNDILFKENQNLKVRLKFAKKDRIRKRDRIIELENIIKVYNSSFK